MNRNFQAELSEVTLQMQQVSNASHVAYQQMMERARALLGNDPCYQDASRDFKQANDRWNELFTELQALRREMEQRK